MCPVDNNLNKVMKDKEHNLNKENLQDNKKIVDVVEIIKFLNFLIIFV
jgi:hypothetical protein